MRKKRFALLAAAFAGAFVITVTGCSGQGETASTLSGSEQDSWIGDQAAVELVEGLSQQETGLSLTTDCYQFEVDDEVGDIDQDTCYIVHAYLVEDGTGVRHLEASLYVAVDGSQVYTYDLNNDAFLAVWDTQEETE